jgi:pimeloyl-ACP methyl ester carboxylesterase
MAQLPTPPGLRASGPKPEGTQTADLFCNALSFFIFDPFLLEGFPGLSTLSLIMRGFHFLLAVNLLFPVTWSADKHPGALKKAQGKNPVNNVVMVNQYGWPVPSSENAAFSTRAAYLENFSNIVNHAVSAKSNGTNKILIFIHGGLNTAEARAKRANILLQDPSLTEEFAPIFINWSSGLGTTYLEHLKSVRQGRLSNKFWGWLTAPLHLVADLGRGAAAAPANIVEQAKVDVQAWRWPSAPSQSNALYVYKRLKAETNTHVTLGCATTGSRLAKEARWLFPGVPGRVVATPLIEAVGQPGWENMLRRTKTMSRKTSEFNLYEFDTKAMEDGERRQELVTPEARGGISEFFNVLSHQLKSKTNYSITLVGHSMGAIIAADVLRNYANLNFENIVFMAAACSIRDVETSVIPYLKKNSAANFYNLCLHPLNEVQEESFWGFAPRGSLLHFIDHSLSVPEHPTDRTAGSWENIMIAYKVVPPEVRDRVHIKAFDRSPYKGNPVKHGEFDNPEMQFWKRAFWEGRDCDCNDCIRLRQ